VIDREHVDLSGIPADGIVAAARKTGLRHILLAVLR
jgi:hypothetical protein